MPKKMTINFRSRMNKALEDPATRDKVRNIQLETLLKQAQRGEDVRVAALQRIAELKAEAEADTDAANLSLPETLIAELPPVDASGDPAPAAE